ncbi:hypothetical protein KC946_03425 [Candidatus Saccharibacteria bacterium]|nr:hypothetical protein [Candidatus Saccharibacteria bacterium]
MKIKQKYLLGFSAFVLSLGVATILGSGSAKAATLNVSGSCTISDAIDSVNAGSDQASCGGTAYGTNDTINIPAGTLTLNTDLPQITESVTVQGAGMNDTIIDGDASQYRLFRAQGVDIKISDMKIQAYEQYALLAENCNVILENLDINAENSTNQWSNLMIMNDSPNTFTLFTNNLYIHDIDYSESIVYGMLVNQNGGGTLNSVINNTTLSNINNSTGTVNGFALGVGLQGNTPGNTGTVNATVTNTTIHNVTAANIAAPFVGGALAAGGDANTNMTIYNVTITGMRGITGNAFPLTGVKSAAFYAVTAGLTSGDTADANINVGNSLLADNLSDGVSSNCEVADLTSGFSGAGTGNATVTSLDYNMSDDGSCVNFTQSHDQQNVSNILSTLGPLINNGGAVPTRALLPGSPAISTGGAVLGVTTDARGVSRPSTNPSIGAYQYVAGVSTTSPDVDTVSANGTLADTGQNVQLITLLACSLILLATVSSKRLVKTSKYKD